MVLYERRQLVPPPELVLGGIREYQHNKNKGRLVKVEKIDITRGTSMSVDRAKQIALEILLYEASRREFRINPHENDWATKARKWGVDPSRLYIFMCEVVFPEIVSQALGLNVTVTAQCACRLQTGEKRTMAYEIVRSRGVDLSPDDFKSRLQRIEKARGVPQDELQEFYMSYVVPQAIGRIRDTTYVSIQTSNEPLRVK